ncbi:MAG: PAS domain-containing protein [Candidatus Eisenbacteria bacterium]|uniref:histidine kinase n=1 Tax=Eiseniibacteriota bacterium TaxID=2212470 RepID=A0A956NDF4_UNCEI|nr:PAS domain-containing protein [Candidatus Eisenbacteria bacterium]MCB9462776.1 PAS domain-containing protein [Candidatus Eisenbacteria bacterium]
MSAEESLDRWGEVQTQLEALRAVVPDLADLPSVDSGNAPDVLSRVVTTAEQLRRHVLRDRIVRDSLQELMGALLRGRDLENTVEMMAIYLCQVLGVGEVLIVQKESEGRWYATYGSNPGRAERIGPVNWTPPTSFLDVTDTDRLCSIPDGDSSARRTDPKRYGLVLPLESTETDERGKSKIIGYLAMNGLDGDEIDWSAQEIGRRVAGMLETFIRKMEKEREDRFRRRLLEAMHDGVLALDKSGAVLEANAEAVRVLGAPSAAIRGTLIQSYEETAAALVEHLVEVLRTRRLPLPREIPVVLEGKKCPINVAISFLADPDSTFEGIVVNLSDLTTLREMEAEIDRLDRLAALGRFAAGIAHEVRNPLAGIGAGVEYLARGFAKDAPQQRDVKYVLGEVHRLNSIVADLLDYTQPRPLQIQPLLATELAEHVRTGLAPYAHERGVRLEVGGPKQARFVGDSARLEQVLLNLVRNAIEASPSGGLVTLSWRDGHGFHFTVEDEGPGFSEEQCKQAFEPFFTTKGNGTGLGLYLSHSIVEQHGGKLVVGNRTRGGAILRVELPQPEGERTRTNACVHIDR